MNRIKIERLISFAQNKEVNKKYSKTIVFDEEGNRIKEEVCQYENMPNVLIVPTGKYKLTKDEESRCWLVFHEELPKDYEKN